MSSATGVPSVDGDREVGTPSMSPHSTRSRTAASAGKVVETISASGIQRKSSPYTSRFPVLIWRRQGGRGRVRGPGIVCGHLLAPEDLAEDGGAVGELEPGDVPGPEEPQAVDGDDGDEPGDDQQAEGQRTSRQPDEGVAAAQEGFHTRLYLSRRRWRTPSAAVLSRKVTANSSRPLRNSTR